MVKKIISICAAGMIVASCSPKKTTAQPTDPSTTDSELTMLVGTYTSGNSKGIYTFRFNEETGECGSSQPFIPHSISGRKVCLLRQ